MKLVYRLTSEHTYIYYFGLALPGLGVVPAWFSPGLQFYRGNIWSLEGVGYTSPQYFFLWTALYLFNMLKNVPTYPRLEGG